MFVIRQWDNVKTIYGAKVNSTETIIRRAEASKEQQRAVLEENDISIVPPTLDQLDSLIDGKTTADEVKTDIGVDTTPKETAPVETPQELTQAQREAKAKERTERSVNELYAYEVDLMASLGALKQEAIDEYRALPESERTQESKYRIGYQFLGRCYDLEAESDSKVKAILNQLRDDLKAMGADTGIADTLWQHYCEEKSTAKEYYLSKYL